MSSTVRIEAPARPPALLAALKLARASAGKDGPLVVHTHRAQAPEVDEGRPWLWLCDSAPPLSAREAAVTRGAYDVISLSDAGAAKRIAARLSELFAAESEPPPTEKFIANSEAARRVIRQVHLAARTAQPVLLTGETGTGKEVCARLLHEWSPRNKNRFIPINCAAIPNDLMEGELFGYAKGAFSGATRGFDGQLMAAQGGTVFLDEIDDTPFPLQIKLLRVLEDRIVTRLGESEPQKVDFRILAATNRDLRPLIASGAFGADLFERLAIVSVQLPPLRERLEDLPSLADHFIRRFYREDPAAKDKEPIDGISPDAMAALSAYPWPGNIRELRNVLFETLVYKRRGRELLLSDLPKRLLRKAASASPSRFIDTAAISRSVEEATFNLKEAREALERTALTVALQRAGGNASRAAALLGEVGRGTASDPGGTVRSMLRRLRIKRN